MKDVDNEAVFLFSTERNFLVFVRGFNDTADLPAKNVLLNRVKLVKSKPLISFGVFWP